MLIFFVVLPVSAAGWRGQSPGGPANRGLFVRLVAVNDCGSRRPAPNTRPFRGVRPLRRLRATSTLQAQTAHTAHHKRPPLQLGIYLLLGRGPQPPVISGAVKNDQAPDPPPAAPFISTIPSLAIESSPNVLAAKTAHVQPLEVTASNEQTANWLQNRRFGAYLNTFTNFSATDLLRLTRDDLIQICGMADGIRLFNALHSKRAAPRLTVYVNVGGQSDIFHALYLDQLKSSEVARGLAGLLGISVDQIAQVLLQGPGGIRVVVTDDVVQVMRNEAAFNVCRLPDTSGERSCLLMTPISM